MLRSVQSKAHMTINPVTLSPETGIFEAIEALLERKISGATVVDADGMVVGVISEMDCLKAILAGTYHGDAGGMVKEFMTTTVESVTEGSNLLDVAEQLISNNRRRFPVVKDGKFVGQLSCRSILRAVIEFAGSPEPPKQQG